MTHAEQNLAGGGDCRRTSVTTGYNTLRRVLLSGRHRDPCEKPMCVWRQRLFLVVKTNGDDMHKTFFALSGLAATVIASFISPETALEKPPVATGPDAIDTAAHAVSPRVGDFGTVRAPRL